MKKILLLISLYAIDCISFLYATPLPYVSTISRVYGNYYSPAVAQNPDQGELGRLNLGFGTNGSLSLSAELDVSQAKAVRFLLDGTMVVLLSSSDSTLIATYTASGIFQNSYSLADSNVSPYFMQLDSQENILVGGYGGWLQRMSSAGVIDVAFATEFNLSAGSWTFIGNIAEQSTGNLIIVGLKDGYTQVARLLPSGLLDTTFGTNGYKIFNATIGTPPLLNSTSGAYNVVVTQDDSILVAYTDSTASHAYIVKFLINGQVATGFGDNGIVSNAVGASVVVAHQICTALDGSNNIIVGATISDSPSNIGLFAYNADTGNYTDGIDPMNIPSSGSNAIALTSIMVLSNSYIVVVSSDTTNNTMRVDQFQPNGLNDSAFNAVTTANPDGTPGYLEFFITPESGTVTTALLQGAAIAPNGQLYVAGYQTTSSPSTTIPYISQIYEYEYVSQVPQYPTPIVQGTLNQNFGGSSHLTYTGVVNPYLGKYRGNLQQHATSAIINNAAPAMVDDIIVGMYGSTDSNASTSMMLNWLLSYGMFDTSVGAASSGQLVLTPAIEGTAEALFTMAQDISGALYVAGRQSDSGAILRKYSSDSTSLWTVGTADWSAVDTTESSARGVGIALQGTDLVLLFEDLGTGSGRIVGYDTASGAIANGVEVPSFGVGGSGVIQADSYGMHMGPVYGACINNIGSIFVAYKNTDTGFVDIAAFNKAGSALVSTFGTSGITLNIFGFTGSSEDINIDPSSVRIAFDAFGNLLILAVDTMSSRVFIARTNQVNGSLDASFGIDGIATMSFSNPLVTQLQGINDGSIVLTGSTNGNQMYIARVTKSGELDTTFNAQGSQPGVTFIVAETNPYQAVTSGIAVQTSSSYKGDLIVIGSQDLYSTDATPMVANIFGAPDTQAVKNYPDIIQDLGTLDVSLNGTGGLNLATLISEGTAQVMYAYPAGNVYEGMLLIGVDTGSVTNIARLDTGTLLLDASFNAAGEIPGVYTASELSGLSALTIDASNRIIFVGSQSGAAWAQRLHADGTFDVSFEIPTSPNLSSITCVGQQQSGRYILAGCFDGVGYGVAAYKDEIIAPNTTLQLDVTFNPMGTYPGVFSFTGFSIYSMAVNQDDTILPSWAGGDDNLYVAKIYANGSGVVSDFGDDGIANMHIVPSDPSTGRIALDAAGNIIAAASISDDDIQVVRYTSAGVIDNTWNPSEGVGQITTVNGCGHSVKLTSLLESTAQQTILLGYNVVRRVNGIHGPMFAVSLDATGVLDITWNPYANPGDVPGILTYSVEDSTIMGTGAFAVNGNVYTIGGTGTEPLLMEIVASGIFAKQDPLATDAGIIDATINTQGGGFDALNLNTQLGLTLGTPAKLHIMDTSNGAMIMASLLDTTAYVTKLQADISLDTTFNPSGTSPSAPGTVAITGVASLRDLFVADAAGDSGTIYFTGINSEEVPGMCAAIISSDGLGTTRLTAPNTLSIGTAIRQGNGNILIAGQSSIDGTPGAIFACTTDMTQLDTSFGNGTPGYYLTGIYNPIGAMTLDNQGRIYIAYKNHASLVVQRLTANGSGVDLSFSDMYAPTSCNPLLIKMVLDQDHNQLIVADYYSPGINITRYNTLTGSLTGTATISTLQLSDLFVDTDQNIYVVSYSTDSPYQTIVARLNSVDSVTIALDTNYAAASETPGISQVSISPIDASVFSIGAAILHPDRRVYVVGADADNIPYMARFFGDNYATQASQAIVAESPGEFDITYGNGTGYAITFADSESYDTAQNQQVKSIAHLQSTQLMTVIDDGINSWTVRVLQDGTNDPSYGTPGGQGALITKLDGDEVATAMIVSGAGEYFVIGNNSSNGTGYLKKITATGAMDELFGGNTGSTTSTSYPAGTVYGLMSNPLALVELTNGNIVIVGNNLGVGTIQMVGSTGIISTTFGGSGQVINGNNITSISADASNNLYVSIGYALDDLQAIRVMKLDETGSFVASFGVNGIVDAVISDIADYNNIQLALDYDDKILVAGTLAITPGEFAVIQLESDGTIASGFNGGEQLNIVLPNSSTAVANLTNIVTLQDRKILIAGYQQDDETIENNVDFVACITDSGVLDTTFNQYELQGSIPGISIFQAGLEPLLSRKLYRMDVQANGQIIVAGSQTAVENQAAPYTMRLIGYERNQAITQYPGDVPVTSTVLNPEFHETGVATTENSIDAYLTAGGSVALDSGGNIIIVGVTSNTFKIARFLVNGEFDTSFGTDGIATSPEIINLIAGCSIVIDSLDAMYVGGITTDNQFIVVKFDATGAIAIDYGSDGISLTNPDDGISLFSGGYVMLTVTNEIIIAGYSSTGQFAINRLDTTGAFFEAYASASIPYLMTGGFIASDSSHNFYIGGATSEGALVVVKFISSGDSFVQDLTFSEDSGVASAAIVDLVSGGTIAIDIHDNIVIGGYTQDETFAIARFTSLGVLDPLFNATGIAYSEPIVSLLGIGSIAIGSVNDVIIGGYARNYTGFKNMVVAVFTTDGSINTQFSSTGIGTSEIDSSGSVSFTVTDGGFVTITAVGQIIVGGIQNPSVMTPVSRLVVAEMYSGYETFITDSSTLSPQNIKTFYYGNNANYFNAVLGLKFYMNGFSDATIGQIIYDSIQLKIDEFVVIYQNVPGFNVTWHSFFMIPSLQVLLVSLIIEYESLEEEITNLFAVLIQRINGLKIL
ncbi:MAG: hypothetical protein Q8Q60_03815 [Candidatus Chromulinivorax sp.]|nr:hypothetical protein [Candidatus Chromulinivorax sp.]